MADKDRLPSGPRAALAKSFFEDEAVSAKLVDTVRIVANKHDATASQVAINWCLAKGTVPIPGARNLAQAQDNLRALSWKLDATDLAALDAASRFVKPLVAKSP